MVTIVIVTFNRHVELPTVIRSVWDQSYPSIEVIVVDDASTSLEQIKLLKVITHFYTDQHEIGAGTHRSLRIIRNEVNSYLSHSRNVGAREMSGEYVLFVDDDDPLQPFAVETMMRIMCGSGSDVVAGHPWYYPADQPRDSNAPTTSSWLVVGGSLSSGLIVNSYSGPFLLVSRQAFNVIDGFTPLRSGCEDWEFWSRAWLLGLRIEKTVEPMYWYRTGVVTSMSRTMSVFDCNMRVAEVYKRSMPLGLENIPEYVQTLASVAPAEYK